MVIFIKKGDFPWSRLEIKDHDRDYWDVSERVNGEGLAGF